MSVFFVFIADDVVNELITPDGTQQAEPSYTSDANVLSMFFFCG